MFKWLLRLLFVVGFLFLYLGFLCCDPLHIILPREEIGKPVCSFVLANDLVWRGELMIVLVLAGLVLQFAVYFLVFRFLIADEWPWSIDGNKIHMVYVSPRARKCTKDVAANYDVACNREVDLQHKYAMVGVGQDRMPARKEWEEDKAVYWIAKLDIWAYKFCIWPLMVNTMIVFGYANKSERNHKSWLEEKKK